MEGRQRRSFTDDYKRQAVDLVASSGRSIGSVAKELGLRDSVLRRWVEQRGTRREPTAASLAWWGAAPPPSAPAQPHAIPPSAAARNRAGQVPWPPIRSSGRSKLPDRPLAACSRPQTTDVDVLPSDTSWLFEPTTGVHQFGGGSVLGQYIL